MPLRKRILASDNVRRRKRIVIAKRHGKWWSCQCRRIHQCFHAGPTSRQSAQSTAPGKLMARSKNGKTALSAVCPPTVRKLRDILRSHWSIENSQHHILNVTFTEDSSRIRMGNGPEIASVFRRLALTILQQDTSIKGSIRGKRKVCGWDESAFERLLAGISED